MIPPGGCRLEQYRRLGALLAVPCRTHHLAEHPAATRSTVKEKQPPERQLRADEQRGLLEMEGITFDENER
jgi:hypothetical protein